MARRTDVLGRGSLAMGNLLSGDVSAASLSLRSPDELSPSEARTLAQRLGLSGGVTGPLVEIITNPIVLIGLAFSLKFPVPRGRQAFTVQKQLENVRVDSWFPMWLRQFAQDPVRMFKNIVGREGSEWAGQSIVSDAVLDVGTARWSFLRHHIEESLGEAHVRFQAATGRKMNAVESRLVAARLDGQLEKGVPDTWKHINAHDGGKLETPFNVDSAMDRFRKSPALERLHEDYRGVYDGVWDEMMLSDPDLKKEVYRAFAAKAQGGRIPKQMRAKIEAGDVRLDVETRNAVRSSKAFENWQKRMRKEGIAEPGERLDKYWTHTLTDRDAQFAQDMTGLLEAVGADAQAYGRRASAGAARQASENLKKRMGRMLPNPEDYEILEAAGLLDARKYGRFRETWETVARRARAGERESLIPYTMDLDQGTASYLNRMANTYAMNKGGAGRKLEEGRKILREIGDYERLHIYENTVLPMVMGRMEMTRAIKAQYMAGLQRKIGEVLDSSAIKDLAPVKWMRERLRSNNQWFAGVEGELTSLMYAGALALPNVAAPALNSLQTFLTSLPLLGRHLGTGIAETMKRGKRYLAGRIDDGLNHTQAMERAFPDFLEAGFGHTSKITEIGLDEAYRAATKSRLGRSVDRFNEGMMSLFSTTETANQLVSFYGGKAWGRADGIVGRNLERFASHVVNVTQFPSTLANAPIGITKLKGYPGGRLASMFAQFGLKYVQFFADTAVRTGAAAKSIGGFNLGTLGRAMMTSGVIYEIGQAFGRDMSNALLFGALPQARGDSPFGVFPFVSPAMSIAGSALSGDMEKLAGQLPVLVPGGVGLARVAGFLSERVARGIGRRYVDWDGQTVDGTYPVYKPGHYGQPPSLIGHFSEAQLMMEALGLPGGGVAAREGEAVNWLLKNRERMLEAKRTYVESIDRGDMGTARRVAQDFAQAYPEIRGGIRAIVKDSDMEALKMRRMVTRLEKVLDSLPAESRAPFAAAIHQTLLRQAPDLIGVDPRLIQTGTARSRHGIGRRRGGQRRRGARTNANVGGKGYWGSWSGSSTGGYSRNAGEYNIGTGSPAPDDIARHSLPKISPF